ncbi:MAG: beta-propeller domain-containing protein [Nocardioidaceae bacterium]
MTATGEGRGSHHRWGRRRRISLMVGATSGALACAVIAAPLIRAPHRPGVGSPPAPVLVSARLPTFSSCPELRQWYVDAALPKVGPYGFGFPFFMRDSMALGADARSPAFKAVGSSPTGTNVQEAGVDEPDTAKTNGDLVVDLRRDRLVATDVAGARPQVVSRLRLPGKTDTDQLLLSGTTVLVFGSAYVNYGGPVAFGPMVSPFGPSAGRTRVFSVDVSDPSHPRITSRQTVGGSLLSARLYADGTVRAVYDSGYPKLDFVYPTKHRTAKQATRQNRRIVRQTSIDDWLPSIRTDGSLRSRLMECDQVRHPRRQSGFGTISVMTYPMARPTSYDATAITAAGDLVYSSADRLYVATTEADWWDLPRTTAPGMSHQPTTQVDAFAVDGATTRYVASGTVPGSVRDRWSFSEYDGHLRVVTGLGRSWVPKQNGVFVLDERGTRLDVVGRLVGLGKRERVQSVRWLDDLAVVTTFRQIDPLYTIDLADPTRPMVLGALKVSGYSAYLHPVGDDLLLGLGDTVSRNEPDGARAATFDLRDPHNVTRVATVGFHRNSFGSDQDPLAFTYLPDQHVALVPLNNWNSGRSRLVALRVGADGSLARVASYRLHRWAYSVRTLPLGGDRVALVDHGVRTLHVG